MFYNCLPVSSANSSDSDELSAGESVSKSQSAKSVSTGMKSHQTKSLTRTQSPGKCGKNGEKESDLKEQNNRLPKVYKWSFQMCKYFLENTPCGIVQKGFLNVLYFGFLVSVLILLQLVINPHLKEKGGFGGFVFYFFAIAAQGTASVTLFQDCF